MISILAYVAALVACVTLGLLSSQRRWKFICLLFASAMALPLLAWASVLIASAFSHPPTLAKLARKFPSQSADLEKLVRMSDVDTPFTRIDPDFVDRDPARGLPGGRFMAGDPAAAFSQQRWNEYKVVFKQNSIQQGIERDTARDAFIIFGSEGFIDSGHSTGIVFCRPLDSGLPSQTDRYEPCVCNEAQGTGRPHRSASGGQYAFLKLADGWFAYDRGSFAEAAPETPHTKSTSY